MMEEPTARQRLASAIKEKAAKAEAHDAWFRAKVEEAQVDTRPSPTKRLRFDLPHAGLLLTRSNVRDEG